MDEIEDDYKTSLEKIEEEFFSEFSKGKSIHEVEKLYLLRLKKAKAQYDNSYRKYLHSQRRGISSKKDYKAPVETLAFKAEHLDLQDSKWDRFKFKVKISLFHFSRGVKNLTSYLTPKKLIYLKFLIKINAQIFIQYIKDLISKSFANILDLIIVIFTKIGKFLQSFFQKISSLIKKVTGIFKKNKVDIAKVVEDTKAESSKPAENEIAESIEEPPVEVETKKKTSKRSSTPTPKKKSNKDSTSTDIAEKESNAPETKLNEKAKEEIHFEFRFCLYYLLNKFFFELIYF
jgi:hypothetical protein